jgi:diguanylate cyclase
MVMRVKSVFKSISIRTRVILTFIALTAITLTILGVVIFSSWIKSAHEVTSDVSKKNSEDIALQVANFLEEPLILNMAHADLITNDFVDMLNQEQREKFFVLSLQNYDVQVLSFAFGTVNGEYYGARRSGENIEIMRNDASTDGHSWYYSVDDELKADERIVVTGLFDPRTRPWYTEAVNAGQTTFSSVYEHFVLEDLAISLATPIYDDQGILRGVLATHMVLSNINTFFSDVLTINNGSGIIIDMNTDELIANSMGLENFIILEDNTVHRTKIEELDDTDFNKAYQQYLLNQTANFEFRNHLSYVYYSIEEVHGNGIDWLIITSIPQGVLFTRIIRNIYWLILTFILSTLVLIVVYHYLIGKVFRPVNELVEASNEYSKGNFKKRISVSGKDEFSKLAYAFNTMADQINDIVNGLEETVLERTEHLRISNETLTESEQRFKILHNASFGGIAVHDKGIILDCNQGLSDITGYSMDELAGMDGLLLIAPDYRAFVMHKITSGYEEPYEAFGIRKSGEIYPLKLEARNIPYKGKQVRVVEFRDNSNQKQLESDIKKEKESLAFTLKSIGDAVIATDSKGIITGINPIACKLTGWSEEEAIGQSFSSIFNITFEDESIPIDDPVEKALLTNSIVELANHTILVSKDNTRYFIEDTAAPIRNADGENIGVVLVFRDVTEKKRSERDIKQLSEHDYLTSLYNRHYYYNRFNHFHHPEFYPLGLIMLDVNGLKIINDAFGHQVGDEALVMIGEVLKNIFEAKDIISRIGGDEFTVLLPNTTAEIIQGYNDKLSATIKMKRINNIELSLSAGYALIKNTSDEIDDIEKTAENHMYAHKSLAGASVRSKAINAILVTLTDKYDTEKRHSIEVSHLCKRIGVELNLKEDELKGLEQAGLFHDIGKISIPDSILNKPGKLTDEEFEVIKTHTQIGYQILRAADEYSDLAIHALHHHERWDGKGYPSNMKGVGIPLFSRIINIVDAYEAMTADRPYRKKLSHEVAVSEIIRCAGTQFDPRLAKLFVEKVLKEEWQENKIL